MPCLLLYLGAGSVKVEGGRRVPLPGKAGRLRLLQGKLVHLLNEIEVKAVRLKGLHIQSLATAEYEG